jgi:hypothetical protein
MCWGFFVAGSGAVIGEVIKAAGVHQTHFLYRGEGTEPSMSICRSKWSDLGIEEGDGCP